MTLWASFLLFDGFCSGFCQRAAACGWLADASRRFDARNPVVSRPQAAQNNHFMRSGRFFESLACGRHGVLGCRRQLDRQAVRQASCQAGTQAGKQAAASSGRQAGREAGKQGIRTNVSEKAAAGGLCPADPGGPNIGLR